jgi:hypothetical protein
VAGTRLGTLRRALSSLSVRLFVCSWIAFSLHFSTNIVREHYPAFSLIEAGTFKVDRYLDFHPDIFLHRDGHAYIGNNVAASVIAAVPLFLVNPALDWLEAYEQQKVSRSAPQTEYRNDDHPNSQLFFARAAQAGLTLRFGASAAVTSVLLMAPLSALMILLMFRILLERGVPKEAAVALSLLFGFGTPVFFRTGVLNHNMLMMYTTFVAFHLLWVRPGEGAPSSISRRLAAGFLAGAGLALDYSGVVPLLVLFGYLIGARLPSASFKTSTIESIPFVLASVPPVLFLLYSQWAMFGNPFLPGQYWMPDVSVSEVFGTFTNPYSTEGFRGFTWPQADLLLLNLFDPSYGMYAYGPLLLVALVPSWWYSRDELILRRPERLFAIALFVSMLLFCASNQYSRIQFNSGFRYMVPLVPILFLAASDHLVRLPRRWLLALAIPALLNSWVISMVREPVPESWQRVLSEGIQFPWLTVLKQTSSPDHPVLGNPLLAPAILLFTAGVLVTIWRVGARAEIENPLIRSKPGSAGHLAHE